MIISHDHEFIFVKTAKTAGTSIETVLSPVCGRRDVFTPFVGVEAGHNPRNYRGLFDPRPELMIRARARMGGYRRTVRDLVKRRRFEHHMPAWQIRERAPDEWRNYCSFCVVRNPWDVVLSGYDYYLQVVSRRTDLDAFLRLIARRAQRKDRGIGRYPFNYWNYIDPVSGEVLVDHVIRYEGLEEGLRDVLAELGVPFDSLHETAKAGIRSRRTISERHAELVAQIYADEISLHGYSIDDFSGRLT